MLPGLPPYLPNLIQSLAQDTGSSFPSSIFTSLLLCMVAGNKHLILRTMREEDVEEVKALVVRVLVTIFGLPTQRIALRPEDTAVDFLHDIFLVPPIASSPHPLVHRQQSVTSSGNSPVSPTSHSHAHSHPRSRHGRRASSHSYGHHSSRRARSRSERRKTRLERSESGSSVGMSLNTSIVGLRPESPQPPLPPISGLGLGISQNGTSPRVQGHERTSSGTSHATNTTTNSTAPTVTQNSTHTGTMPRLRKKSMASSATINSSATYASNPASPPQAPLIPPFSKKRRSGGGLVVPSLFHPAGTSDDAASVTALRPQSTHGLHIETNPPTPTTPFMNLPRSSSPHEYPPLVQYHLTGQSNNTTSQLSPSAGVTSSGHFHMPSTPRLPHALVLSKLEKSKLSVQNALADVLRNGRIVLDDYAAGDMWIDEDEDDASEEAEYGGSSWNLPAGFVVVYVCALGDGKDRVDVERSLLDRFGFNGRIRLEPDLYNASPGPFRRTALISREDIEQLQNLCGAVHLAPRLQNYVSSLLTAVRGHPQLDSTLLTARVVLGRYERSVESREPPGPESVRILSATDSDARKMLVNALEHRLSVRKGVGEEVLGSLFPTVVGTRGGRAKTDKAEYSADDEREGGGLKIAKADEDGEPDQETIQTILYAVLEDV
ncbi:hypothetical protein FRB99_006321 [Tulasnella sp. 403]|nr:hypothetical protein FRB99_006321 [Tulasnella sp. 403]